MEKRKEYILSDTELKTIQEIENYIKTLQLQKEGALMMILRQQNLPGDYRLVGNKLIPRNE